MSERMIGKEKDVKRLFLKDIFIGFFPFIGH